MNHEHFHTKFNSSASYKNSLDDPSRDAWQLPERVIAELQIPDNGTVVDVGAGTGYFVFRIAQTQTNAKVIGLDIEPVMIEHMRTKQIELGIQNVEILQTVSGQIPELPSGITNVLCVNAYHHLPNPQTYFSHFLPILTDNGIVTIIDFTMDAPMGPPQEFRSTPEEVERNMVAAGYTLQSSSTFLPHQFFLQFSR